MKSLLDEMLHCYLSAEELSSEVTSTFPFLSSPTERALAIKNGVPDASTIKQREHWVTTLLFLIFIHSILNTRKTH